MFSLPYMRVIVPVFSVVAIVALAAYVHLTLKQAKYLYSGPVSISVTGVGEAFAVPDIATFSFSVLAEADDATDAQSQSAEKVNTIVEWLKSEGVEEKDIKTNYYNLNPRYDYVQSPQVICVAGQYCPPSQPGERVFRGYEVTQSIEVKVRDTDKAGALISGVGERGTTDASGLQFTVDDEESIKAEAREKAIADAKEKAEKLAEDLGVRIVRMNGYWEDQGYYPYGMGGGVAYDAMSSKAEMAVVPNIPTGENKVTVQVNLNYEVK